LIHFVPLKVNQPDSGFISIKDHASIKEEPIIYTVLQRRQPKKNRSVSHVSFC